MIMSLILYAFSFFVSVEKPGETTEVCLSNEEKELYELIMKYRKSKKLKTIPYSPKLSLVAQTHARDLIQNYDFSQDSECNPHSWSKKGKWTACCYTPDHAQAQCMWDKPREIADYQGDGYEIAFYHSIKASPEPALEGWKKSSGHNPLLVNSGIWKDMEWKGIGIGMHENVAVVWFGREEDPAKIELCE